MMSLGLFVQIVASLTFLSSTGATTATEESVAPEETVIQWTEAIARVMNTRDGYLEPLRDLVANINMNNMLPVIALLEEIPSGLRILEGVDFTTEIDINDRFLPELFNMNYDIKVKDLYRNQSLETDYKTSGLGFILERFKNAYDNACLYQLISPPRVITEVEIPLERVCAPLLSKQANGSSPSISSICTDVNTCTQATEGNSEQSACTEDDKCDVEKALPKMGAVLWYKISNYIASVICDRWNEETRELEVGSIRTEASHIAGYMATMEWDVFYREATSQRAFYDLHAAMRLVGPRKPILQLTAVACGELGAQAVCVITDIANQYVMLEKIRDGALNSGPTRDLRINSDLNHQRLMDQHVEARDHLEVLGEIRSLDENLETAVKGISTYFERLAELDEGIANADVAYIEGELNKFFNESDRVNKQLESDFEKLNGIVLASLTAQLLSAATRLASVVAQQANPIKTIVTGVDVDAIYEATTALAQAIADVGTASAIVQALHSLGNDTFYLANDFEENQKQIKELQELVNVIRAGQTDRIDDHSNDFVKQYGEYTPMVARSKLEANSAKWSAYKETACNLLSGSGGPDIEIPIGQTVQGGMLICEKFDGTLAEFFTLREDIYDFQFDLVDALARVVRGSIAKRLASSITTANDPLHASQLMRGFFMLQYRIQSDAYVYCNVLQYKRHGKRLTACPTSGFVNYDSLNTLSAVEDQLSYHQETRDVYIPTRPSFQGDTGYINFPSLAQGNTVSFQIPQNRSWLEENHWVLCNEVIAPFVTSFKLYLPLKSYANVNDRHVITTVTMTTPEGSKAAYAEGVRYILPKVTGSYRNTYEEGYSSCTREIDNPYSLCDNLPKLCSTSTQDVTPTLRPTVLSTWTVSYTKTFGASSVEWQAPNSSSPLYLKATVKLHYILDPDIQCGTSSRRRRRADHCCRTGEQYFVRWSNTCVDCPNNTVSSLDGYYCERNP